MTNEEPEVIQGRNCLERQIAGLQKRLEAWREYFNAITSTDAQVAFQNLKELGEIK